MAYHASCLFPDAGFTTGGHAPCHPKPCYVSHMVIFRPV